MKETERTGQCRHVYAGGQQCSHMRIAQEPFCRYHRPTRRRALKRICQPTPPPPRRWPRRDFLAYKRPPRKAKAPDARNAFGATVPETNSAPAAGSVVHEGPSDRASS
jgi:hypothetical protein